MYHYTYLLRNSNDGLLYIGVRSSSTKPHLDNYKSSAKTVSKEYLSNCRKSILKQFPTRLEANTHEISLHAKFRVASNPKFFNKANATTTKFDRTGVVISELQRQNMRRGMKAAWTAELRQKASDRRTGIKLSDITKAKLRAINLGSNSPKAKQVLCVELSITYGSISEAALAHSIHYSGISKVCNGSQKRANGYTWKYT